MSHWNLEVNDKKVDQDVDENRHDKGHARGEVQLLVGGSLMFRPLVTLLKNNFIQIFFILIK
jgi:hypothetical protein